MIFRSLGHSRNLKDYDDNGQSEYDESYSFEDWDRNARIDGWVCRADVDCEWIDPNLGCDDREFEIKDIQVVDFYSDRFLLFPLLCLEVS